jgi:DNA-binding NtrC family response regulator
VDIQKWIAKRDMPGSVSNLAKRMAENGTHFGTLESTLRQLYTLEVVIANGGDQKKAAGVLGVTRHTVRRVLREAGIGCADIRAAVKQLSEAKCQVS